MNKRKKIISVVVPVFDEEELINHTINKLQSEISTWDYDYEIIYVNDGSTDNTLKLLINAAEKNSKLKIISFSKNFGHQMAFTAGLDYAKGDAVIVIDGDLQDPPRVMNHFIKRWEEGYDVVYGKRIKRKGETLFKLFTANLYYRFFEKLSDTKIPRDVGDFRLMDKSVVSKIKDMRERHRFIRGMVSWVGFKQCAVEYERDERIAGETKYPFKKMLIFALDGIFSFSTVPLKIITKIGFLITLFSFLYLIYIVINKILGYGIPGFASIIVSIVFLGGVQLISIGILGQYVGRTFEEIKGRPLYIVEKTINID